MVNRPLLLSLSLLMMPLHSPNGEAQPGPSNLEIIQSTYNGDSPADNLRHLQHHLAEQVHWIEAAGFPYAGTYIGFDAIASGVFHRLAEEWVDYRFQVDGYVAADHQVVAYGTYSGRHKTHQRPFHARVAHLWTLKHGKITRFEQFVDSKSVTDAMP